MSVRLKLTLSYAGFLMLAGVLLLAVVWVFLLRYVPPEAVYAQSGHFSPGRDDLLREFVPRAGWALFALLLCGLGGGWVLAGRMLAPLNRITAATRLAATGSLSHRIQLEGHDDEFRELADAFDAMLARLEAQVGEQRRFAANASHELRTPLAISRTILDVARKDSERDVRADLERLHTVNARAIALTEALLLLSRADQRAFERELVGLPLMVDEAVETLLPLAEKRGVALHISGQSAVGYGSPALLLQVITNLVHNAIVHNLAEDGVIWITTGVRGATVFVVVENTGDAVSPELAATLTEPFQRGTERINRNQAGVGLGLAIVKSIVQSHDGALKIAPRKGGGLAVLVELPSA
ncbi:HAMP domain-containing histidine kinase [Leucobacter viscericola]|uniref:histidine kinase n=1 Tax=Leucobacter viscericola TaxID=2714935 RepID=A0A6G7XIH2_9MICO|nr:HAMP domain-containing sensor histidine kinase [Leucobacter viscericola]QIK64343.1 HAMP domain-containing histidine kinase [Leucobacter viscericola]